MTESVHRKPKARYAAIGLLFALVAGAALSGTPASALPIWPKPLKNGAVLAPTSASVSQTSPAAPANLIVNVSWTQNPATASFDVTVVTVDNPLSDPPAPPLPEEDFVSVVPAGTLATQIEVPRADVNYNIEVCNQLFAYTDEGGVFHPEQDVCLVYGAFPVRVPGPEHNVGSWYSPYTDKAGKVNAAEQWAWGTFHDFANRTPRLDEQVAFRTQLEGDRLPAGVCGENDLYMNPTPETATGYGHALASDEAFPGDPFLTGGCKAALTQMESLRNEYVHPHAAGVIRLYRAYFLRRVDFSGLQYWVDKREAGWSLHRISDFFAGSAEFKQRYGDLDNGEYVARVYLNVLSRDLDPAGYAFWLRELNSGNVTRGRMMTGFSESPENKTRTVVEVGATEARSILLACTPQGVPTEAELVYLRAQFTPAIRQLNATDPPAWFMQYLYRSLVRLNAYKARADAISANYLNASAALPKNFWSDCSAGAAS